MLISFLSFFDNKGAVAGVFTVVGLVGLVIFIAIATNVVRRRRAKRFDDEVAAAAAEASASPRYPFDDYDDNRNGGYGGTSAYSDPESHGTLNQAPLTHSGESYNMSEFNSGYPSYGNIGAAVGAGAAGIGASRSLSRRENTGNNNIQTYADPYNGGAGIAGFGANQSGRTNAGQTAPYSAFSGPLGGVPGDPYDPYTAVNNGILRQNSRGATDLLDAAGVGVNRGPSQSTQNTQQQNLGRSNTQATSNTMPSDNGTSGGPTQESYAAHYQPDFRPDEHKYEPPVNVVAAAVPVASTEVLPNPFARDPVSDEEAYGAESYYPNGQASREDLRDEQDYGRGGRMLKVCEL